MLLLLPAGGLWGLDSEAGAVLELFLLLSRG